MKQKTKQKLEKKLDWDEERMDIIGQNGNDGEHYHEIEAMPNGRWNWWDEGEDKELTKRVDKIREREEAARKKLNYYSAKAELVTEGE